MDKQELDEILRKHQMWLNDEPDGERAVLRCFDLDSADLHSANLCNANLHGAYLCNADLSNDNLCGADLFGADLLGANLLGANLCAADLRGANLDYSCWPLRCGSLDIKVDARIARQLAYHFCRLDCDDPEYLAARRAIAAFANGFHHVEEYGRIEG